MAKKHSLDVAAAESLTSGSVATRLGAGTDASVWFRGAIVAYAEDAKFRLLGVDPGPVVTASCATQMAQGVSRLFESQVGVAVTGVGGPEPVEGRPPGTVFVAVFSPRTGHVPRTALRRWSRGCPRILDQLGPGSAAGEIGGDLGRYWARTKEPACD